MLDEIFRNWKVPRTVMKIIFLENTLPRELLKDFAKLMIQVLINEKLYLKISNCVYRTGKLK